MAGMLRQIGGLVGLAALVLLPGPALAKNQYVYVHDRSSPGGIYAWRMDKDGSLTSIDGSPFPLIDQGGACRGNCQTMAYSPKRKVLYTGGPMGVSAWTVNKDGTLTSVPGSPFEPGTGGDFLGTGIVQAGKRVFVYASSFDDGSVYGWETNKDGSLVELAASPFPSGDGPSGLATRKKFVFVANENDGSLSSYVAKKDGTLVPSPSSPFFPPNVGFTASVYPTASGKVLYPFDDAQLVRGFSVAKKTAELTQLSDSPFATAVGGDPFSQGVLVTKKFAYAISSLGSNAWQPFTIGKKGTLEATGIQGDTPFDTQTFTSDAKGKRIVFAGEEGVATYTISDKKQGELGQLDTEGFVNPPKNVTAVVMVTR
jgi:hypothetical protein